jgi:hypothetical protein
VNEIVSLDQLATEIRYYSQQASWSIIEVGKRLIEAKKQVAYAEWENWLDKNVGYSKQTARRFMQCAERFGNRSMSSDLSLSQVTELLSLPEAETETFIEQKKAEGNPVEDMTVKTLRQEIKDWKNKAEQAEQANNVLSEQFNELAEQLQDLRNNPQVVEVQTGITQEQLDREVKRRTDAEHLLNLEKSKPPATPHDYEYTKRRNVELERELAAYKAHEEGMTLQQKAEIDAEVAKYKNTASQEIQKSIKMEDLISAIHNLPKNMEVADFAESYVKQERGAEERAKADIRKLIIDLRTIHDELDKYINKTERLRVVK